MLQLQNCSIHGIKIQNCSPHLVVYILPVVEGDKLERRQHGPKEVIEAGVSVIRILAYLQAQETRWTMPETIWKQNYALLTACDNEQLVKAIICPRSVFWCVTPCRLVSIFTVGHAAAIPSNREMLCPCYH